ncbi:nucleotidyltransferase family protein [bacterium]|nr:nucleotidyltransferase family protein [bacterium]
MEKLDIERLIEVCRSHDVRRVALFGSFVRGEEGPDSDIDLIVEFLHPKGYLAFIRLERELTEVLGRKVDLLTEQAISPHLRERILSEQEVLYEAAG